MGYGFRRSDHSLIWIVWSAVVDVDGSFTDAANEFWGLGFERDADGRPAANLIGPSLCPRSFDTTAGERAWGVEFRAHTFLRRVPKQALAGDIVSLWTDGEFFELGGVRFPVPTFDDMETLVDAMHRQGLLVADDAVGAALAGDDPGYSSRQLRRRTSASVGLGPKQIEQLRRARNAYRLLSEGASLADAAATAGYSDQAHLTRSFRQFAGMSPARILDATVDSFSSRP